MGLFDDLDKASGTKKPDERILHAPFGYPGGKTRSVKNILPHLPYKKVYVEPFGGSAAILLARKPSRLEVYNDRYAGVVAFYRCLRDPVLFGRLTEWLELTVHSKEEFYWCKDTWKDVNDPVERAGRWYYMSMYSFSSIGRNWGRTTSVKSGIAGKIRRKLELFPEIHERFKSVQVENQDWEQCIKDYQSKDAVIYCDPPYLDVYRGTYENEMSPERHKEFLDAVHSSPAYVAVSGYSNPLYESYKWDARYEWDAYVSVQGNAPAEGNNKSDMVDLTRRATEVLWIKKSS